jgi:hypothetical protein
MFLQISMWKKNYDGIIYCDHCVNKEFWIQFVELNVDCQSYVLGIIVIVLFYFC